MPAKVNCPANFGEVTFKEGTYEQCPISGAENCLACLGGGKIVCPDELKDKADQGTPATGRID